MFAVKNVRLHQFTIWNRSVCIGDGFRAPPGVRKLTWTTRKGLAKAYEDFAFRPALGSHWSVMKPATSNADEQYCCRLRYLFR